MTSTKQATQPLPRHLPWDLGSVLSVVISVYILAPMAFNSLLILAFPLLENFYRLVGLEILVILVWLFVFYRLKKVCSVKDVLGLRLTRPWPYYAIESLLAVMGAFTLIYAMSAFKVVSGLESIDPYPELFGTQPKVVLFAALFVAPVLEELVFRGFVQSALAQRSSVVGTLVLTSVIFLLFHGTYLGSVLAVSYVFLLGLLLSYFRYRTGSVIPGIMAHLANNTTAIQNILG